MSDGEIGIIYIIATVIVLGVAAMMLKKNS